MKYLSIVLFIILVGIIFVIFDYMKWKKKKTHTVVFKFDKPIVLKPGEEFTFTIPLCNAPQEVESLVTKWVKLGIMQ